MIPARAASVDARPAFWVGARRRHAARLGVRRVRPPLAPTARHLPAVRVARRRRARPRPRPARSTRWTVIHLAADPGVRGRDAVHRRPRRARRRHAPLRAHRRRRPRRPARRAAAAGGRRHASGDQPIWYFRVGGVVTPVVSDALAHAVRRRRLVGRLDARRPCARAHARRSPRRSRSSTRPPIAHDVLQPALGRRVPGGGRSSVTQGVWPGDVVSVQLPNWYETVAVDLGVLALGAVLNPLLPNYRARELHHILGTARIEVAVHARRVPRLRPRRARARARTRRSTRCDGHVVVRGGGDFWQRVLGRAPARSSSRRRIRPRSREVIFTSGTEATPKGVMHTEHTTNCNVRSAYAVNELGPTTTSCGCRARSATPPASTSASASRCTSGMKLVLQDRWDAERAVELIERERCSYTLAATTFLTDLVAGRGTVRPRRVVAHPLRLRWRAGTAGDRAGRRRRGHQRAAHLRAHRSARRELEPRRLAARASACTPTAWRCPEVELDDTAGDGEVIGARPERVRRPLRRPRARAHASSPTTAGCTPVTPACSTTTGYLVDRRAHEGDHHPRRPQHRAARDRGPAVRDAARCGRRR